jgi:hypothetical protein
LWQSVASESAAATPSVKCARAGEAAAHRPNVAGLNADERHAVERRQRIGSYAALAIDGNCRKARFSESCKRKRLEHGDVNLGADDNFDLRRAEKSAIFDGPTRARKQGVTGGGESREIRHGGAGYESAATLRAQAEQFAQPFQGNLFQPCRDR